MLSYEYATGGKLNLYRHFIERSQQLLTSDGVLSFIVPSTLIADKNTQGIRLSFKEKGALKFLIEFPEKEKVFESVTQATTIFLFKQGDRSDSFKLSVGLNTAILPPESFAIIKWKEVEELFGESLTFPLIKSENELTIMKAIRKGAQPLAKVIRCYRGDINLGTFKSSVRSFPAKYLLVRGEHIQEYLVDISDKNVDRRWFDTNEVFSGVSKSRVVSQHIANMGLRKRLVAGIIPANIIVGDSANCFEPINTSFSQKAIVALLNSNLLNWYYKKISTNNNVNIYEMDELPIRQFSLPQQKSIGEKVDKLVRFKEESKDRSILNSDSSIIQSEIDAMVYELYELNEEFKKIIENDMSY